MGADSLRFTLQGEGTVPDRREAQPPAVGGTVTADLTARGGHELWAIVVDEAGGTLYDAEVKARWRQPDGRWIHSSGTPAPPEREWAGYVRITGVPPATVRLQAHAPGFASRESGPIAVPEREPTAWELVLSPAARLKGIVLEDGSPVPTFELCYWKVGSTRPSSWKRTFADREDGSFEVDDAPAGELAVLAVAPARPPTATEFVDLQPGAGGEVVLEVQREIRGKGQVVSQTTGEPIARATVQRYTTQGHRIVAYRGAAEPVRSDGTFELGGFVEGRNLIVAEADGYGSVWRWQESVDGLVDFGRVALAAKQHVRVRLSGAAPDEVGHYSVDVEGVDVYPGVRFSEEGLATVGPVSAANRYHAVLRRHGKAVQQAAFVVHPGIDKALTFEVRGGTELTVHLVPEPGQDPSGDLTVRASGFSSGDSWLVAAPCDGGVAVLRGCRPGAVEVTASRGADVLGRATTELSSKRDQITLQLDPTPWTLRVVDQNGHPLQGANAYLRPRHVHGSFQAGFVTDADGTVRVPGLAPGPYVGLVQHQSSGSAPFELEVAGSPPADPVSIVVDATCTLTVTVLDRETPVQGALCRLSAWDGSLLLPSETTDERGRARWTMLARGEYTVAVEHGAYWPTPVPVRVASQERALEVRLLKRSRLDIVATRVGRPSAGVSVQLESVELGGAVSGWMEQGWLPARADGIVTDARGKATVAGLPEGAYRWRARGSDGTLKTGLAQVERGGSLLEIEL